jgi:hypothetical protein
MSLQVSQPKRDDRDFYQQMEAGPDGSEVGQGRASLELDGEVPSQCLGLENRS